MAENETSSRVQRQVWKLLLMAALMFAFGFALVPLYNVTCKKLGLNGRTDGQQYAASSSGQDLSRTVEVEFLSVNPDEGHWAFHPETSKVSLHPGESVKVKYYAKNKSADARVFQAVPSVAPSLAAPHIKKLECFCFQQQSFKAREGQELTVVFFLDRDIPKDVKNMTLSYTLFDVTDAVAALKSSSSSEHKEPSHEQA